jgi:thioredoxin 1
MHPVLENLNKKFSDVKFLLVNVDKFQEIAGHYGVSSIPSIFFLKEGNIIKNVLGYHPERELEVEILELFK